MVTYDSSELRVGRLIDGRGVQVRHLALLLAAEGLRKLTNAKAIRITLTQFANQRYVDDANNPDAMMLVSIIELDDDELELLAKVGQNCQLMDSSS